MTARSIETDLLFSGESLGQTVLVFHFDVEIRRHADHRDVCFFFQHHNARVQDGFVPAEFVDNQTLDAVALIRL